MTNFVFWNLQPTNQGLKSLQAHSSEQNCEPRLREKVENKQRYRILDVKVKKKENKSDNGLLDSLGDRGKKN